MSPGVICSAEQHPLTNMASTGNVYVIGDPKVRPVGPKQPINLNELADAGSRAKSLFLNGSFSDAVMEVGYDDDATEFIPVHSSYLSPASKVFAQKFSDEWKGGKVRIRDCAASSMKTLLRWIYCFELVFLRDDFAEVLKITSTYSVTPLIDFVIQNFPAFAEDGFVWILFDFATAQEKQIKHLIDLCINFIARRSQEETLKQLMAPDLFENVSQKTVVALVKAERLSIPEIVLFTRCHDWARAELERQSDAGKKAKIRDLMEPFIKHFVFVGMRAKDFAGYPCASGVLTWEEQALILREIATKVCISGFRKTRNNLPPELLPPNPETTAESGTSIPARKSRWLIF